MTNADRIRAMTDEELAEFIEYAESYKPNGISFYEWLRQEVSDNG